MLRISKLADYGTVVMVYLARNVNNLSSARDIAEHTHLQLPTVSKLLKKLTASGLLLSVRGMSGGYRLQRQASAISILDIIYALDRQRGLTECSGEHSECALQSVCQVRGNWQIVSKAIDSALSDVSLETLAKPVISKAEAEQIRQAASGVRHEQE